MHHPQILVVESDGRLAALLEPLAKKQLWALREPRQADACVRLLQRGGPGVLVMKIGRNLEHEFALLDHLAWLCPDTGRLVIGEADHSHLAGLAWDLGADCVLFLPQPPDRLVEIVVGLMQAPERMT
jgi:DNA-binding NtrC family response regulator